MSKKDNKNIENKVNRPLTDEEKLLLKQQELEALSAAKAVELRDKDKKFLEEQQKEEKREERNKKIRRWTKIAILILIMLLLLVRCSQLPLPENVRDVINMGFENTIGKDEVQEKDPLEDYDSRKALLTISMNKVPIFGNGISEGNLNIVNDERNVYYQYVEIYLDGENGQPDMNKLIYKSNLIDIGQVLQMDALDVNLPAGTYKATAYFNAVDPETMEFAGKAGAKIEITVVKTAEGAVDLNSEWWVVEEPEVVEE